MAVAAPFLIETVQYLVPILGRGCQSGDVIDDLTGLALGLAVGLAVGSVAGRLTPRSGRRTG